MKQSFNSITLAGTDILANIYTAAFTVISGMIIDDITEKLGIKYYTSSTSPITDIAFRITKTGTNTPTYRAAIFGNTYSAATNGTPDLTNQLSGWASFTPSATGWTNLQTLATDSGNLTINDPVWIVIEYSSGTFSGDSIQLNRTGTNVFGANRPLQRHYDSVNQNWITTATQTSPANFVVKHADNSLAGVGITTAAASPASATDIFGSNVQGVRFKCGSQIKIWGVSYYLVKTGSPNNLVWTIYEGDTAKYTMTETVTNVLSITSSICWFASPILLAADTNLYLIGSQESAGGSDTNDYDIRVIVSTNWLETIAPPDVRFVYGTGSPSGLTVSTTEIPLCFPVISDPALDLDMSANGMIVHPSMNGGMNG